MLGNAVKGRGRRSGRGRATGTAGPSGTSPGQVWPRPDSGRQVEWGHVAELPVWFTAPAHARERIGPAPQLGRPRWGLGSSSGQDVRILQGFRGAGWPLDGPRLRQAGRRSGFPDAVRIRVQPAVELGHAWIRFGHAWIGHPWIRFRREWLGPTAPS